MQEEFYYTTPEDTTITYRFPVPALNLLGSDWSPLVGLEHSALHSCVFPMKHWSLVDTSDCSEFLILNECIMYPGFFCAQVLNTGILHYVKHMLNCVDPEMIQVKLYVKPCPSAQRDFSCVTLKVVMWKIFVNERRFMETMTSTGAIPGEGAFLKTLKLVKNAMLPVHDVPYKCVDETIIDDTLPPSDEWTRHALLPEQEQSVLWMKNLERRIQCGENNFTSPRTVRFLNTPFMYSLQHEMIFPMDSTTPIEDKKIYFQGGILTDKLGTGKTAVALRLICDNHELARCIPNEPVYAVSRIPVRASLVIVPINLTKQWKLEVDKFLGEDYPYITVFNSRDYDTLTIEKVMQCSLLIVSSNFLSGAHYMKKMKSTSLSATYSSRRFITVGFSYLREVAFKVKNGNLVGNEVVTFQNFLWRRVIHDESHEQVLNEAATDKCSQILNDIRAQNYWGLTGTPCLNDLRMSSMIFRPSDQIYYGVDRSLLIKECIHRSPHLERLLPVIVLEHLVDISERERQLLNAYKTINIVLFIQICTSFSVLAIGGPVTDEQIVSMTFSELAELLVVKRSTDILKIEKSLESLAKYQSVQKRALDELCNYGGVAPPNLDEDDETKQDDGNESIRSLVRQLKLAGRRFNNATEQLRTLTAEKNFFQTQLSNKDTCPICLCEETNILTTCGHWFCKGCVVTYLNVNKNGPCPVCKTGLQTNNWIETTDTVTARQTNRFGSKLMEIVSTLQEIKSKGEKAILFCQWQDLSRSVKAILVEGGVKAVSIVGNSNSRQSAIKQMATGEADVLILSLDNSNSGLNLIEANHVIFAHAIAASNEESRVTRINQAIGN